MRGWQLHFKQNRFVRILYQYSMKQTYTILVLLALLSSVFTAGSNSGTITYGPKPVINSTAFYQLDTSPVENNQLILSNSLINLVMTQSGTGGGRQTTITASSYKRSAPTREITTSLTLSGNWTYIEGQTRDELTCLGIYDDTNFVMSPVRYDRTANTLTVTNTFSIVGLAGTNNVTLAGLMGNLIVGSDCFLFGLTFNNFYREFTTVNQTVLFQVEVPSNTTPKAFSDDLRYGVWINHVYRWTNLSVYYSPIATLAVFDQYFIKSVFDRPTVAGRVSSAPSGGFIFSNYTLYTYRFNGVVLELVYTVSLTNVKEVAGGNGLDFRLSPSGDKLFIAYNDSLGVFNLIAKKIDYANKIVTDLVFDNIQPFTDTAAVSDLTNEWDVTNEFMVIKNVTNGATSNPIEVVYQMINTQVLFVRSRSLSGNVNQTSNFVRVAIDPDVTSFAYALQIYRTSSTTFELWEIDYGNYFTNNVILRQTIPNYITFAEPSTVVLTQRSNNGLAWFYQITGSGNTNFTLVYNDNATSSNVRTATLFFNSAYTFHFQDFSHLIIEDSANAFYLYKLNTTSGAYVLNSTITSALVGTTITSSTVWGVSTNGDRFRVDNKIFAFSSGSFTQVATNVTWVTIDNELLYILGANKVVYHLNTTDLTFKNITNSTVFIPASATILSYPMTGAFAITYLNATSAEVQLFAPDSNGNTVSMFNFTFASYTNAPTVHFSPMLTKVLIFGTATVNSVSTLLINAYSFDFATLTFDSIKFPTAPLTNTASLGLSIGDNFLYARQVTTSNGNPAMEWAYFLSGGIYPQLILNKNITATLGSTWLKAVFIEVGRGYAYLMNEFLDTTVTPQNIVVTSYELWNRQSIFDNGRNYYVVEIRNSLVNICPFGCKNCQCSTCFQGFALDLTTSTCRPCQAGCAKCLATDTTICQTCMTGRYLNTTDSTCLACSPLCVACSSVSVCTVCAPGQFVSAGNCVNCPANCFNCSSASTCLNCREGFVLISNVTSNSIVCGACTAFCSECNPLNITECITCQRGMYKINGICQPCAAGCLACTNANTCDICQDGFTANSVGVCEVRCQLPCLTCSSTNPTLCLSCQSGSTLDTNTNTCVIDLSCNSNSSCVTCGQALNYFLLPSTGGATCQLCPVLPNCVQCDYIDPNSCAICAKGLYRNSTGHCVACTGNCLECRAPSVCSSCKAGFTLKQGFLEGECIACAFPCTTCIGSPFHCLTCASGTSRLGWTCRNTARYVFSFVLTDSISNVLVNIRPIKNGILQIMGSTNEQDVIFSTLATGSTIVTGTGQTSGNIRVAAQTFQNGMANGIPGTTYQPSNVNVQVQGAPAEEEDSNIGMIVGIAIGGVVFLIIVIAIICYCCKNRRSTETYEEGNGYTDPSAAGHNPEGVDRNGRKGSASHLPVTDTNDGYNKGSYPNLG